MNHANGKVDREKFLMNLELLQPGLPPRESPEQSKSFVFSDGFISTFNEEVLCRCPSMLSKEIEGSIPSETFLNTLRKLPEKEITVEVNDSSLILKGSGRYSKIRMETEVKSAISDIEEPTEWKALANDFSEAVSTVHQCAGDDASQFVATCVHIHPEWIEASDRFQICRWPMETGLSKPTLVRKDSIKHVANLGITEFAETDSWLHFRNANSLTMSCRRYMEDFPELTQFLNVKGDTVKLPKELALAADLAYTFSKDNPESDRIQITLEPGWVKLVGTGIYGEHGERKRMNYEGKTINFLISPKILSSIVKKFPEGIIGQNQLRVNTEKYTFVACLFKSSPRKKRKEDSNGS